MSAVVAVPPIPMATHRFQTNQDRLFNPNQLSNALRPEEDMTVLPHVAKYHSPVRISVNPGTSAKRQSQIADLSRSAIFKFRPVKDGETPWSAGRFRPPDSTRPTHRLLSPWVSVTKTDFMDPRSRDGVQIDVESFLAKGFFQRSSTDADFDGTRTLNQPPSTARSLTRLTSINSVSSRPESRISAKSGSTEKRVTIIDPSEEVDEKTTLCDSQNKTSVSPSFLPQRNKLMAIKQPEHGANYYSGYLPPELSDKIAVQLNIGQGDIGSDDISSRKEAVQLMQRDGFHYKPLIGDRSLYRKESYPVQPKLYQSDIDQLRIEGHERLLQSNGQHLAHFSAVKDKRRFLKEHKYTSLDEAKRDQQRLVLSASNRRYPKNSSLETFQRQKERTYFLQNLAREMINKDSAENTL